MNRFFSKLDLRDIKIDPEGSRFPPDADEHAQNGAEPAQAAPPNGEVSSNGHTPDAAELEATTWESPIYPPPVTAPVEATPPSVQPQNGATPAASPETFGVEGVLVGNDGEVLKVSARSRPSAVAGAIAGVVREAGRAEVQAIGAGATNQAVKAVAIARDYLRETGIDAICLPAFIDVTIENEDRTAIRLVVEPR